MMRIAFRGVATLASAAAGLALIFTVGTVSPAMALPNSFSDSDGYAAWSYNDGNDRFCVRAKVGSVRVKLNPVNPGNGPSYNRNVAQGTKRCNSLATAYEDSRYSFSIGTRGSFHSGKFYS